VLGSPIGHSLSPVLHRAAYAALGLDWVYDAHEVTEDGLPAFVDELGAQWRGLSLTMPLKAAVLPLCTQVTEPAALLRSVNTVVLEPDGGRVGHNTDVPGAQRALRESGVGEVASGIVVGSGATAASAMAALVGLGAVGVTVLARDVGKASRLVTMGERLGARVEARRLDEVTSLEVADVLVSTIPADAQEPWLEGLAGLAPVVLDVVYAPAWTPLLAEADGEGAVLVPGFAMLLHQAALQVELMTGCAEAPLDAMRAAGLQALATSR
jgi:shikimate dehydrogenase